MMCIMKTLATFHSFAQIVSLHSESLVLFISFSPYGGCCKTSRNKKAIQTAHHLLQPQSFIRLLSWNIPPLGVD